jgi:hypothetical protein
MYAFGCLDMRPVPIVHPVEQLALRNDFQTNTVITPPPDSWTLFVLVVRTSEAGFTVNRKK